VNQNHERIFATRVEIRGLHDPAGDFRTLGTSPGYFFTGLKFERRNEGVVGGGEWRCTRAVNVCAIDLAGLRQAAAGENERSAVACDTDLAVEAFSKDFSHGPTVYRNRVDRIAATVFSS
jgi:hypothetical protein